MNTLKGKLPEVGFCHFHKEDCVRDPLIIQIMDLWFNDDEKDECAQLVKGFTEAVQRFGQLRAGCQMFFHECVKRGMNQGGTPAPDGCAVRKAHAQGNSPQRRAVYHARIATVCNGL
jgi:hypothetical protein